MPSLVSRYVKLKFFNENLVNNAYLKLFKDRSIRKFLKVEKNYNLKKARNYFKKFFCTSKNLFWFIFKDDKNIGTISLRYNKNKFYLGYMIGYKKYWGKKESIDSQNIIIDYAFNKLKINEILASCNRYNLSSGFSLIKSGFEYYKKKDDILLFRLKKKNWKKKVYYQYKNEI